MTNDSSLFNTAAKLKTKRLFPVENKCWKGKKSDNDDKELYLPLYEGKMVQAFDHRAASIDVNLDNMNRPAQPVSATLEQHQDPDWLPDPQYWVERNRDHIAPRFGMVRGIQGCNCNNKCADYDCSYSSPFTLR